jgi:hypothetical protein
MTKLITDLLNGFSMTDLKLLFLELVSAAFLGIIIFLFSRKRHPKLTLLECLLIPLLIAFVVAITRNSAPLSISVLGIFILFSRSALASEITYPFSVLAIAGFGCGTGNVIVTFLFILFLVIPIMYLWHSPKEKE